MQADALVYLGNDSWAVGSEIVNGPEWTGSLSVVSLATNGKFNTSALTKVALGIQFEMNAVHSRSNRGRNFACEIQN
jgi:hypothetical protein